MLKPPVNTVELPKLPTTLVRLDAPPKISHAFRSAVASQIYDMLGNAWEWVDGGEPARRTLRGGSFVDHDPQIAVKAKKGSSAGREGNAAQPSNHAITPATRMETTQDSGSANTSFRCASPLTKGGASRKGDRGERRGPKQAGRGEARPASREL